MASLWRNYSNYTGRTGQMEYGLGVLGNVLAMYVAVVPEALLFGQLLTVPLEIFITVFLAVFILPVFAAYVRRIRDIGWKPITAIIVTAFTPVLGGVVVGLLPTKLEDEGHMPLRVSIRWYLIAIGFGLYLYGAVLGILLFDDPVAIPALPAAGLFLITATILIFGVPAFIREMMK